MESVTETTNESKAQQMNPVTVKHVREVMVNYRGQNRASVVITSASVAAQFIRKALPDNSREHLVVLYLDGAHQIIGWAVTSTGSATSCPVILPATQSGVTMRQHGCVPSG